MPPQRREVDDETRQRLADLRAKAADDIAGLLERHTDPLQALAYAAGLVEGAGNELLDGAIVRARETHRLEWREVAFALGLDGDNDDAVNRLMNRQAKRRQTAKERP